MGKWTNQEGGKRLERTQLTKENIKDIYFPKDGGILEAKKKEVEEQGIKIKELSEGLVANKTDNEIYTIIKSVIKLSNEMVTPVARQWLSNYSNHLLNLEDKELEQAYKGSQELYDNTIAKLGPFKEAIEKLGREKLSNLVDKYEDLKQYHLTLEKWIDSSKYDLTESEEKKLAESRNNEGGINTVASNYSKLVAGLVVEGKQIKDLRRLISSPDKQERTDAFILMCKASKECSQDIIKLLNSQISNYQEEAKARGYKTAGDYILSEFSGIKRQDIDSVFKVLVENRSKLGGLAEIYTQVRGEDKIYSIELKQPLFPEAVKKQTFSYSEVIDASVSMLSTIYPKDVMERYVDSLKNKSDTVARGDKFANNFVMSGPPDVAKIMSLHLVEKSNNIGNLNSTVHESAHLIHNIERNHLDWVSGYDVDGAIVEIPSYMHESLLSQDVLFEKGTANLRTDILLKEKANVLANDLRTFDAAIAFFSLSKVTLELYEKENAESSPWTLEEVTNLYKEKVTDKFSSEKFIRPEGLEVDWMRSGMIANMPAVMNAHAFGKLLGPMLAYEIRSGGIDKDKWVEALAAGGTVDVDEFVQKMGFKGINEAVEKAVNHAVKAKLELDETLEKLEQKINPVEGESRNKKK